MLDRKLVTLRKVAEIRPIPNADFLELAIVDGWQCVVKKGEFQVGDNGVYFEIDSFIPIGNPWFEFLRKDAITWNNTLGVRIRTRKLRGQLSQGLLLKPYSTSLPLKKGETLNDLTDHFKVQKWERDIPAQVMRKETWFDSVVRFFIPKRYRPAVFNYIYSGWLTRKPGPRNSSFPSFIPKTDQERIQNVINDVLASHDIYEVTTKMNGSSMTVYVKDGKFGHCSRNVKLGIEDGSNFSKVVKKYNLHETLLQVYEDVGFNFAIQGEMCGPGVQGNYEMLEDHDFFVFAVFDIDAQKYLLPDMKTTFVHALREHGLVLKSVPNCGLKSSKQFLNVDDFLQYAEGKGLNCPNREGVVFNSLNSQKSFKVVANSYLLKGGD